MEGHINCHPYIFTVNLLFTSMKYKKNERLKQDPEYNFTYIGRCRVQYTSDNVQILMKQKQLAGSKFSVS